MFGVLLEGTAVAVAECDGESPPALLAEERILVERAVAKRQRQFAAGRACAREALATLGVDSQGLAIGRAETRAPIWPEGFAGSITHTEGHCAAAVTRIGEVLSVGIDVERRGALDDRILERICSPEEREALAAIAAEDPEARSVGEWGKLVFSAKEAFYKAFFPLAGIVLGFRDGHLEVDAQRAVFRMTLHDDQPLFAGRRSVTGRFAFGPAHVFTAVAVPRDPHP